MPSVTRLAPDANKP
ncbi:hypothetical protein YPPY59_1853, partial [Yersinia pestis PY-59]